MLGKLREHGARDVIDMNGALNIVVCAMKIWESVIESISKFALDDTASPIECR